MVGHLDPDFIKVMDDIKKMLRLVFRTANEITFPVSGTGSAGMQTVMANLIEAGDEVVIGTAGVFGTRMVEVATRLGAKIHQVDAEWGRIVEPERIEQALKTAKVPKLVAIVHAETSTGIHQPIEEISKMAHAQRRADGGRRSDVARMRAAGDRRLADRRLLQLHAKRSRCAAGAVAGDVQRARDGSGTQAQDAVHLVVPRPLAHREVLGPRPRLSSYRADHDELRAVRSASNRGRRGARGALSAPSGQRVRAAGGDRGNGDRASRRRKVFACRSSPRSRFPTGIEEAKVRAQLLETVQHRDRRRAGAAQGQGVAYRTDGRVVASART